MGEQAAAAAPRVHGLIAAGLAEPELIEVWLNHPELARRSWGRAGVDDGDVDVGGLRRFAGFITMVRQNPLRRVLPLTFQVLAATGLEIQVFAAYAPHFARLVRNERPDLDRRVAAFVAFLRGWLDPHAPGHVLLRDTVAHELAVDQVRRATATTAPVPSSVSANPAPDAVPWISGPLRIMRSSCDPRQVAHWLSRADRDLSQVPSGDFFFGYWCDRGSSDVHVMEITPLAAWVLSAIDGTTTVAGLARRLGELAGAAVDPAALLAALRDAADRGLLVFSDVPAGGGPQAGGGRCG